MFAAVSRMRNLRGYGFGSVRTCLSGGAPLPVELHEAFERLTRARLLECYGLTEASAITHMNPLHGRRGAGSVGAPLPNTDARVVDPANGVELAADQVGELMIKGPQVMAHYWGESPGDVLRAGWLPTGDLAAMDGEGFFHIVGRQEDVIRLPEGVVYARDVEEVLYENNQVLEAAALGSVDADGAPLVKAYVVLRPRARLTSEELINFCQHRLAPHAVPASIEFRLELPRSATGKLVRSLLETASAG
jgi:long-chain acyl-CoA synthetase